VLVLGLAGLVLAAQPHPSRPLGPIGVVLLVVALGFISITGIFAAKIQGTKGSVALGGLAGIGFGAAAVASRPLAGVVTDHGVFSTHVLLTEPLLYLLIAHSLVGQLLLGLAMQRGSTTAAVAAMDAAAAVPAAVIGLLFLGDRIAPGRQWFAIGGFLLTLGAVIGLTFFAEPQHHHQLGQSRVAAVRTATGSSQAALGAVAIATVTTGSSARAKASRTVRMSHARARARARHRTRTVAVRWPQR
jgi:hypothetical protein